MNIFKAYYSGLKESVRLPRPVFLIYFINLFIALLIVIPIFGLMNESLGDTLSVNKILKDFDATVFADFIANSSNELTLFFTQVKWVVLIYWIISIFLAGGIIRTLNQDKFTMTSFFSGAGYNFFRFLGISLIMIVLQILLVFLIYAPTFNIIDSISDTVSSELTIYKVFFVAFGLHMLLMLMLFMISDYSKFYAALYDKKNIFKSVMGGFRYVFKNFFRTYTLYILLIILPLAMIWGYFMASGKIGTHTVVGVLLVFLIQQAVIILRIWFRVWIYASPLQMYTADFLKQEDVQRKISQMNEWHDKATKQEKEELDKRIEEASSKLDYKESDEEETITVDEVLKQVEKDKNTEKEKIEMPKIPDDLKKIDPVFKKQEEKKVKEKVDKEIKTEEKKDKDKKNDDNKNNDFFELVQ